MTSNPTINPIIVQTGGGGLSYTVNSGTVYPANVTSITLPAGATSIGSFAFYGFSSLASIVIPAGVKSIGVGAFQDCSSLTSVVIPTGVTAIGSSVFQGCSSLTSVVIPTGVTTIGISAFQNCASLPSITIPVNVASIGASAFQNCTSLRELTVLRSTPPTLTASSLTGVPADCSIRVPAGSVAAYKAAANWSARAAYITAI